MHQRCVIHRDLKMGNLFIDAHMNIKIGDFGLAAVVVDDRERRQTMCGTPNYIAPELLAKSHASRGHGHKVDTWAIGIICYAMLIGTPPFASKSQTEIYEKLKQLQYEWKEDCQYFIPHQAKDLVTLCLNLVPAERPGMDDLVEHEFFKIGAIAEELDRSCLGGRPTWLEHADPRGDRVMTGYGEGHAEMCKACGVGKTSTGQLRPPVGGNVTVSAMVEVHLENAKGCAPVVPMPEGVVYKEFTAAKEDWNAIKKRPLTIPKARNRKEPTSAADTFDMNALSTRLPKTESARSISTTSAPGSATSGEQPVQQRAAVQSFAAQQRQQALPSRAASRRVIPTQLTTEVASTDAQRAQSTRDPQTKQASDEGGDAKTKAVGQSLQTSRGFLREQPVRAVRRITRSTTGRRHAAGAEPETTSISDQRGILTRQNTEEQQVQAHSTKSAATSSTVPRPRSSRRQLSPAIRLDGNAAAIPPSLSSGKGSADTPLRVIDANDRQPKSSLTNSRRSKPETRKAVCPSLAHQAKPIVIGPADKSYLVPGTSPENVLRSLEEMYRELTPKDAVHANVPRPFRKFTPTPHPVVEKWVDYTERYGIGYILSDGTAGLALKSSNDNAKSRPCVVVRCAKEHYIRRIREEEVQIVPQGAQALPVEFYESLDDRGLRETQVPASDFRYDEGESEEWIEGKELVARLSTQAKDEHAAERVRLVGLLDKFGKYMTNLNASDTEEVADAKANSFIKFYQRLGNVGIWGFGDGSYQFNFPDHTKLLVHRSGDDDGGQSLMLDLYYLQPEDAAYLAKYGSMTEGSMERRDSVTAPVSEIFGGEMSHHVSILARNQVLEKLSWIRGVVSVWVREGGLGRMGKERLAWTGLQDRAAERSKRSRMVWVTVGRDGGDGEVVSSKR
jgi:Protein kinase domain